MGAQVPPDVMLLPMALAGRERGGRYILFLVALTTSASVLGGVVGWYLGAHFLAEFGQRILQMYASTETAERVRLWYETHGSMVVVIAAFTPVPYKVFTVTSGLMKMDLFPFILASIVGRGGRFCLVGAVAHWGNERLERFLRLYFDKVMVVLLLLGLMSWASAHVSKGSVALDAAHAVDTAVH